MKKGFLIGIAVFFATYITLLCLSVYIWTSNIPVVTLAHEAWVRVVFYLFPVMVLGYLACFTWFRYKGKISMQEFMVFLILPPSIGYFISTFFTF